MTGTSLENCEGCGELMMFGRLRWSPDKGYLCKTCREKDMAEILVAMIRDGDPELGDRWDRHVVKIPSLYCHSNWKEEAEIQARMDMKDLPFKEYIAVKALMIVDRRGAK